jgi:hypothetical protein
VALERVSRRTLQSPRHASTNPPPRALATSHGEGQQERGDGSDAGQEHYVASDEGYNEITR